MERELSKKFSFFYSMIPLSEEYPGQRRIPERYEVGKKARKKSTFGQSIVPDVAECYRMR
jgi:hypothetical protein